MTRHVARAYDGDRTRAVRKSIQAIARHVPLGDTRSWTEGERPASLIDALGGTRHWPTRDREILARLLRAKGGRRERDFEVLAQALPALDAGMRHLAGREATRRARRDEDTATSAVRPRR